MEHPGFSGQSQSAWQYAFRLQPALDCGLHGFPDIGQEIPDFRVFLILHIFPKRLPTASTMLEDCVHRCMFVDRLGWGKPSGHRIFAQGATANAEHFPIADDLPGRIQGFEAHAIRMKGWHIFWLPDKTDIHWREGALDGKIGQVAFARCSQAAKQMDSKGVSLGKALPKESRGVCRAHRMTAGRTTSYSIKFTNREHQMILPLVSQNHIMHSLTCR